MYKYLIEQHLISKEIVDEIADYLLINCCSIPSSGLMRGRAGISMALFEMSRLLGNEELEDHAFDLIQEALVSKNESTDLSNGLAGIGYTLLYLIENKFIDADFDELFGENHSKIVEATKQNGRMQSPLDMFYFAEVNRLKPEYSEIITSELNFYMTKLAENLNKRGLSDMKTKILTLGVLQLVTRFCYYTSPDNFHDQKLFNKIIKQYGQLIKENVIEKDAFLAYYLNMPHFAPDDSAQKNDKAQPFLLKRDLLLSHIASVKGNSHITCLVEFSDNIDEFEKYMAEALKSNQRQYSLENGLSYLALYLSSDNVKKSRFDKLFTMI